MVTPPPTTFGPALDTLATAGEDTIIPLPDAPVLYMGMRDSLGVRVVPVGEISGDTLVPLPDDASYRARFARERMAEGARFTLFAEGTRVGTLTAASLETDESFCPPRPSASGPVELIPAAADAGRFLALRETAAEGRGFGAFSAPEDDRERRIAALNLTGGLIPEVGARWPTSLEAARVDMQALRLAEGGPDAFSATFVFRDQLGIQPAEPSSWAMFVLGVDQGEEYRPAYVWYREAGRDGRGVPLFWEHYDWDGDGETELLLQVLGEELRWTAAVGRVGGEWQRIHQDPCGVDVAPPTADEAG